MAQISQRMLETSHVAESLVKLIHTAIDSPEERDWKKAAVPYYLSLPMDDSKGSVVPFPDQIGIYAVVRYFMHDGKKRPRVMYVGISHSPTAGIRDRLSKHFGKKKSSPDDLDNSRFANAVWEIVQNDEMVYNILNNDDTRIAVVPLHGKSKNELEQIEELCIQVLKPLLNIR